MKRIENIIKMLSVVEGETSENVKMAKGKYKYPYTIREIFQVKKRELKYRKDGKRKGRKVRGTK